MTEKLTKGRSEPNLMPSKTVQREYLRQVRQAADAGDTTSMVGLLILSKMDAQFAEQKKAGLRERLNEASGKDDVAAHLRAFGDYLGFMAEQDENDDDANK